MRAALDLLREQKHASELVQEIRIAMPQTSNYCVYCDRRRLFVADNKSPDHVLHLVITFLVCGLWLPVWIFLAVTACSPRYRCSDCGNSKPTLPIYKDPIFIVVIAISTMFLGFALISIAFSPTWSDSGNVARGQAIGRLQAAEKRRASGRGKARRPSAIVIFGQPTQHDIRHRIINNSLGIEF